METNSPTDIDTQDDKFNAEAAMEDEDYETEPEELKPQMHLSCSSDDRGQFPELIH